MSEQEGDYSLLMTLRYKYNADVYLTGSRAICKNPPEDSDTDYLVTLYNGMEEVLAYLKDHGFEPVEGSNKGYADEVQWSLKRGNLNLILSRDAEFSDRWKAATEEAKRLGLKLRSERAALFREMVDEKTRKPEPPTVTGIDEEIPF